MTVGMDRERLETIVQAAADRLPGDWLLVGGAAVALWLDSRRVTEDVDLIGMNGTADERAALMNLAIDLGLPVEAVNSAADFFVRRVEGWRDELVLLRTGLKGRVWRPTTTLLVLLKVGRLSEIDLGDCMAALERAAADGERVDRTRIAAALDGLASSADRELQERRARLRAAVT